MTATHTEQFTIRRRPGWGEPITVTIESHPLDTHAVKLGLAMMAAVGSGENLRGAYLGDAVTRHAKLRGAVLTGADLTGAVLIGEKITRLFARLDRQVDPHSFAAMELEAGGYKILAGCRWFSDAEFRAHVAAKYPDTDKAVETLTILDFIASRAVALGITKTEDK